MENSDEQTNHLSAYLDIVNIIEELKKNKDTVDQANYFLKPFDHAVIAPLTSILTEFTMSFIVTSDRNILPSSTQLEKIKNRIGKMAHRSAVSFPGLHHIDASLIVISRYSFIFLQDLITLNNIPQEIQKFLHFLEKEAIPILADAASDKVYDETRERTKPKDEPNSGWFSFNTVKNVGSILASSAASFTARTSTLSGLKTLFSTFSQSVSLQEEKIQKTISRTIREKIVSSALSFLIRVICSYVFYTICHQVLEMAKRETNTDVQPYLDAVKQSTGYIILSLWLQFLLASLLCFHKKYQPDFKPKSSTFSEISQHPFTQEFKNAARSTIEEKFETEAVEKFLRKLDEYNPDTYNPNNG